MTDLQWYAYLGGFVAFAIGCYLYYLSRSKELNDQQIKKKKKSYEFFFDYSFSVCWLLMVVNIRDNF